MMTPTLPPRDSQFSQRRLRIVCDKTENFRSRLCRQGDWRTVAIGCKDLSKAVRSLLK